MQSIAEAVMDEVERIRSYESKRAEAILKKLQELGYFQKSQKSEVETMKTKARVKTAPRPVPQNPPAPPATPESLEDNGEEAA